MKKPKLYNTYAEAAKNRERYEMTVFNTEREGYTNIPVFREKRAWEM